MKKYIKHIKYSLLAVALFWTTACDEGFDDLNENPVSATSIDPMFLLNNAMINSSYGNLVYEFGIVQQIISPNSGVLTGANFNQDNRDATDNLWQQYYRNVIRNTRDVIATLEDTPERGNLLNMARIWQAFAFMVLTDTYGDVPYTEGGKGFIDQVLLPVYDPQEDIYNGIIQELTEATAALNAANRTESADIMYGGDITKWKRLGYSLLLRAGMRLSKVNPTRAQQVVQAAFQGGVILDNADNCVIRHDANYVNGVGNTLNATEANNYYLADPFVSFLQDNNDPRLQSIAVRYVGATSGPQQIPANAVTDPAVQVGMPLGYDNNTISQVVANLGLASFYDFSQVDRTRMARIASPMFIVTASQNLLLLAEAAQRTWINGNAGTLYNDGIRAHMEQLAAYGDNTAVEEADIVAYLNANPLVAATALEQINTQYWVSSFLNSAEAFANFRRSGFPALAPNPFPGQDLQTEAFIRRLTYPNDEISVNPVNLNAAVSRMGPDILDTRVWWDRP